MFWVGLLKIGMKTASTNILFEWIEQINQKRIQGDSMYCPYQGKNIPFGPSKRVIFGNYQGQ
jgi:hypothetical protein